MLRMGKNPQPTENEKQTGAKPVTYQPPAPAQPQPQPPSQYTSPDPPPARPETQNPPAGRAVAETEALAREIKDGTMSGFVGGGTVLSGEAVFKGMLRVDGHLTGRINSENGTLIVSSGGRVDANINVATAKINGVVNGDIVARERLEFGRTAQVYGDIQTPVLVIEEGAVFEGSCRMKSIAAAPEKRETLPAKEPPAQRNVPLAAKTDAPEKPAASSVAT
ncbi:MAG TPA: polymer-forming cytoskeletal protein [Pyrinomonadaceae bacterium]|nr:polymer-forming cytoskeletal protein [Pyrinomonadaceae bacterium]